MGVAGIQFNKLNIERKKTVQGKVNINNNLTIKEVIEQSMIGSAKTKQSGALFTFNFIVEYLNESKLAVSTMDIEGELLYVDEATKIKSLLEAWKKNKTLDKDVLREVMNAAMTKCNVSAIVVTRELNLPPPVPLPRVQDPVN